LFLAEFLRQPGVAPELALEAMEAIRTLGLPQSPRPGKQDNPVPPATSAAELLEILETLAKQSLDPVLDSRRNELKEWLTQFEQSGDQDRDFAGARPSFKRVTGY
jgi:hypothetical protein